MDINRRKILINGGGIAGLTAALCLAKTGNRVDVFERAPAFEEIGAGIQISPNAFHVLSALGLACELLAAGDAPASIIMIDAVKGKKLATLPLGFDIQDEYDAPYLVLHRADLQDILLKACNETPDIKITFGAEIEDAAIHKNGVTALVKLNHTIKEQVCDVLIGADGVHSGVRQKILELPDAKYAGKIAWRALIPAAQIKPQESLSNTHVWLGPKAHAVTYPVQKGNYLNVIAVTQEVKASKVNLISESNLKEKFAHWSDDFTQFMELGTEWSGWPLFETPSVKTMVHRNVALIGDAAHAMMPFAAQGAAQAIEDAHVLAQRLAKTDDTEAALKQYEATRLPRVKRVVKTAQNNGRIYHLTGVPAMARNLVLSKTPGKRLLRKQDWIYGWRPE